MSARFFRSIPSSVLVKDPYEEVFSLFTTDTAESPWAHNRSVSQQSTHLELELDFTPVSSPAVSQPGSRPSSRSGYPPTALPTSPLAHATESGSSTFDTLGSPDSGTNLVNSGLESPKSSETYSVSLNPSSLSSPITTTTTINTTSQKIKNPVTRLIGGRKATRNGPSKSVSATTLQQQQPNKKPIVIHQSLSTLSQPGQTGTVVWDSSILMSKFMLSIKDLEMGCFRSRSKKESNTRDKSNKRVVANSQQEEQIRRLEEQAETLAVSDTGELKDTFRQKSNGTDDNKNHDQEDEDVEDDDEEEEDEEEGQDERDSMLIFDPAETTILELGSGCGLLGIVMAELCQDLLLTDQKPVLPLLMKNLKKNLDKKYFDQDTAPTTEMSSNSSLTFQAKKKKDRVTTTFGGENSSSSKPCRIQVQELVWGQDLDQDLKRGLGVDFVIATDVVYNESVVPLLVHTLKELCEIRERVRREYKQGKGEFLDRLQEAVSQSKKQQQQYSGDYSATESQEQRKRMRRLLNKTVVLIAQELRTDYVHLAFLEELQQAGFRLVRIPKHLMDADFRNGYVIYACSLSSKVV
ncbi:hypothetical protein BGZ49_002816 [Haplosporangium sp. Z 27]|nr:hypothetical protein BGZ49_002816 [Haplosporangium sp. Z 27]